MKDVPALTAVKSSHLDAIGHAKGTLFIRFRSGGIYAYPGVPEDVYREGLTAESVGGWFRNRIRGTFRHRKLDA